MLLFAFFSQAADNALLNELKGQRSAAAVKKPELYGVIKTVLQRASERMTDGWL